jgi:amino acid adenylation domain-containing protein
MNAGKHTDTTIHTSALNLVEHLRHLARVRGDEPWLTVVSERDGLLHEKVVSYGEFERRVRALAAVLQQRFSKGERALVMLDNDDHYAVAMLGCFFSGVMAVPVFPPESTRAQHLERLVGVAADAQAACVLTTAMLARAICEAGGAFDGLLGVAVDEIDVLAADGWALHSPEPQDVAFLQYTSGSTSAPKGVMVTHGNLMANERLIQQKMGIGPDDRFVSWSPLYHDMGLIGGLLQPLFSGIPLALCSPQYFLERPARWLEMIARHRGTVSGGPDFAYRLCLDRIKPAQIEQLDLSSWRLAYTGAEPIRAATEIDFCERFARAGFDPSAVYACYGLAEATLMLTGNRRGDGLVAQGFSAQGLERGEGLADQAGALRVGCGDSGLEHTVEVVDPVSGRLCEVGVVGEIWASGPSIAAGYWNKPDAAAETFVSREGLRWLRTGDLGFELDGQLYVTGRIKDLIIVRGHNIYPQDIEHLIEAQVEAVRKGRVAAFAVDGTAGEGIGVAVEVSRGMQKLVAPAALVEALSATVSEVLGEPLSVVVLLNPGALPKTSSGKLQRQACRRGWSERSLDAYALWERGAFIAGADSVAAVAQEASFDATELALEGLWREVLRTGTAQAWGREAHFFLVGGNSLAATQVAARVASHWKIAFPPSVVFEWPRLGDCAREVTRRVAEGAVAHPQAPAIAALPAVRRGGTLPLSPAQQRQWFLWRLDPSSTAYHIATVLHLSGTLDAEAMRRAFSDLVARHEILRTVFQTAADGTPEQRIVPAAGIVLERMDLSAAAPQDQKAAADGIVRGLNAEPFDLARAPLLRAVLLRLGAQAHRLVLVMHHIVSDAVSMQVLVDDLAACYRNARDADQTDAMPVLPIQYADYAAWQGDWLASGVRERQLAYWKDRLGDEHPVLSLPTDRPRAAVARYQASRHTLTLPPELVNGLRHMAASQGATLFMALLTGLQALLHRHTGQRDIRVGVPFANRHHAGTEGLMGFFVNTLVLRNVLDGRTTLGQALASSREATLGAQANQDLPFEQLVEALQPDRSLAHQPLFQVLFNQTSEDLRRFVSLTGLRAEAQSIDGRIAQFELSVEVRERGHGAVTVDWLYAEELFDAETVARLAEHHLRLLSALASNPGLAVGEVDLLSAPERGRLTAWSQGEQGYPVEDRVHALFERQVQLRPKTPALRFADDVLSYEELDMRANQLANHLVALGVKPETRVGIAMERSVEMVVGLLGIMKAGGAYVPLDPEHPRDRIDYMVQDSRIGLLLTVSALRGKLPAGPSVIELDALDLSAGPAVRPDVALHGENLVYVIYTSGSTGTPKGAGNRHRALCNRLAWGQRHQPLQTDDVVLQKTPFSFDISFWEFFWPLSVGATLVLAGPGEHRDPARLTHLIAHHGVTTIHFVPSMLQAFLAFDEAASCQRLRRILCSGEALSAELQARTLQVFPQATLLNLYGPTEAAVEVTYWDCCDDGRATVPIGRPIGHLLTHLLDESLNPVPQGVAGELYLGGLGLARGYWDRPGLTAERFVADPLDHTGARLYRTGDLARWRADGQIEYLGRMDHQAKIRGFRVELGEVEAALQALPGVREATVVTDQGAWGVRLVAYVSGDASLDERIDLVRQDLGRTLPDYMVPSVVMKLDRLPLNANGKVDRKALPAPVARVRSGFAAPKGRVATVIAQLWSEVLGTGQMGLDDNFFDLGGHSLMLIRMHKLLQERLQITVSVLDLFQYPSVGALSRHIEAGPAPAMDDGSQARGEQRRAALLRRRGTPEKVG